MKIWKNKDFKVTIDSARRRTKRCGAEDDIDSIYLLEKEIESYKKALDMACEVLSHDLQKIDINGDEKLVLEKAEKWKEFFLNYEDND